MLFVLFSDEESPSKLNFDLSELGTHVKHTYLPKKPSSKLLYQGACAPLRLATIVAASIPPFSSTPAFFRTLIVF